MEFLVLWLGTSAVSFCLEIANEMRIFKDAADAGYKIRTKEFSRLQKQINPNASNATILSLLIPIFNIMQVFQRIVQYNNSRSMLLDQLNIVGVLEEMTEIEKQEYLKKPTALNSILVPLKLEVAIECALSIIINKDNQISEIFFEIGKSFKDITVLKVTGPISKLTVQEQTQIVVKGIDDFILLGIEKYGNIESFKESLNDNYNIYLNYDKKDEVTTEKNVDKEKITINQSNNNKMRQELEDLKFEILKQKLQEKLAPKVKNKVK